ncbi:5'-3' exoribonuclease 1 isoform X2 [Sipha flava]|nr:5'-3' exoribonuclease 1 isoform X2 [Sipha flava]
MNEKGTLNLKRFQKFMETLANFDYDQFRDTYADIKYLEGKRMTDTTTVKADVDPAYKAELAALIKDTERILLSDEEEDLDETEDESLMAEFSLHKENYYRNKLDYNVVTDDVMRSQAEGYIRALQWNLNYYYNGCCSWSWYYPHHYAPYISDIKDFENLKIQFDIGQPFLPFQQLLAVLPSLSKELLPKPFQELMTEEASPIRLYYPEKFDTDLNGKKNEWEAVVLIPFIDEETLIKSMKMVEHKLTPDEKKRNEHGPMHSFKRSKKNLGAISISKYFPSIEENYADKIAINREDIAVDIDNLVKGLCPGVQLDVYHIGFPSLHFIPITAQLQRRNVKVFQSPSLGENMIVKIVHKDPGDCDSIQTIAKELLGNTVYVNWPHLEEMKVISVLNTTVNISINEEEQLIIHEMDDTDVQEFNLFSKNIAKTYITTRGIEIGKTDVIIRGQTLRGTKYVPNHDGNGVVITKVWSDITSTIAYQTTVPGLEVTDSSTKKKYFDLEEYFPPGSTVFTLDPPFFGCQSIVVGEYISSRVKIDIMLEPEPYYHNLKEYLENFSTEFFYASAAASKLSINTHLVAKITGTILLMVESYEDRNEKKINIGMNLKSNKRNEEVVGYTKKFENTWMYSQKTIDLLDEYIQRFPEIINVLLKTESTQDTFKLEEMFPDPKTRKQKLDDLKKWIGEIRSLTKEWQTFGSMDPCKVAAIEKYMDNFNKENHHSKKSITLNVKPPCLFKPVTKLDKIKADDGTDDRILDRVICVRSSYQVPLGLKGIIISISKSHIDTDVIYSVIFDKEFPNGMSFNGSVNRGYKLCRMSFINLSHAIRNGQYKPLMVKVEKNSNSEKQNAQISIWEHLQSNGSEQNSQEEKFTLASKVSWRTSQKKGPPSVNKINKILPKPAVLVNNEQDSNNKIQLNAEACEFKTIALKRMLKIQSDENSVSSKNQNENHSKTPINYLLNSSLDESKQVDTLSSNYNTTDLINENVIPKVNNIMGNAVQQVANEKLISVELEKFYALKGYGLPKYSCTNLIDNKGSKIFCAELILPNGVTIRGEPKYSKIEAIEEVSSRAFTIVQQIDTNKNNGYSIQNKPPKPDRRIASQQGQPNVFGNFLPSHQQHPHFQQQPFSQVPQYFERPQNSFQQFRPPFQQFPPGFLVPNQQSYPMQFQQVYRQQNPVGFPVQQQPQQFFNNPQEMQFPKALPTYSSMVTPSQLPQPPVHWQPTHRNSLNNEYVMGPMPPNIYHPPQQNINYQQYPPTTSNNVSTNEQYMSSNRVMIPSPSSAFTSAANTNDQSTTNRKVKVAANFNSSQQ